MELEELKVYQKAMDLGEEVWQTVIQWQYFEKDTIGKQLVKASDSVAANISEGFGRFHYNETKHFGYYSRGSLFETKTWLTKASNRKLIEEEKYLSLLLEIESIGKMLNAYIKSIGRE
jgi:four helix bundle protein